MLDLSVEAVAVAAQHSSDYLRLHVDVASVPMEAVTRYQRKSRGVPVEYAMEIAQDGDAKFAEERDVSALALAALGPPRDAQPLFLFHEVPRDSMVSALARLVERSGWAGDDIGVTQLEELGGTVVFDLLDWAMPDAGATALICDEPLFADARQGGAPFCAVALRVRPGDGPLRVLDCGEGEPGAAAEAAGHRFAGSGPCDGWLNLFDALAVGAIADGERILVQVRTSFREGWVLIQAQSVADLRLARAAVPAPEPTPAPAPVR